jgi:hypothetical protein
MSIDRHKRSLDLGTCDKLDLQYLIRIVDFLYEKFGEYPGFSSSAALCRCGPYRLA